MIDVKLQSWGTVEKPVVTIMKSPGVGGCSISERLRRLASTWLSDPSRWPGYLHWVPDVHQPTWLLRSLNQGSRLNTRHLAVVPSAMQRQLFGIVNQSNTTTICHLYRLLSVIHVPLIIHTLGNATNYHSSMVDLCLITCCVLLKLLSSPLKTQL